ncbi:MAG: ribosome maturation factor RimP, partial [Desulfobacterales bacterium]
ILDQTIERPLKVKKGKKGDRSKIEHREHNTWSPDNMKKMIARIRDVLDPLCTAEGIELVHIECQREAGGRILRLYIDRPGGVTLDDCISISRQSSDLLDVYIEDAGPYNLEVSSPGLNRPLGKKLDFDRFKGSRVTIKTARPVGGKKKITGILLGISEDKVSVSTGDRTVAIPYDEILTARLSDSTH